MLEALIEAFYWLLLLRNPAFFSGNVQLRIPFILGLLRAADEQTIFFSSFEPFRREVRDAAQRNNAAAKEASKFLDQAFGSH